MNQNISKNIAFTESLDTVNQGHDSTETTRVENIFKLSALFSKQIILSDTQFVDNRGIRDLFLNNKDFQDFLGKTTLVGLRPRISSFSELVEQQIKGKFRYSSFPSKVQKAVERGEIKNIYHLNSRYPELQFEYFIEKLDDLYDKTKNKINVDYQSYANLVEKSLERADNLQDIGAKKLCSELMSRTKDELKLKNKENPDRSIFYSTIEKSPYNSQSKNIVKRFFIDYEYNRNFWDTNGFNCLTHPNNEDTNTFKQGYTNIAEEFESNKYMIELPPFHSDGKLYFEDIDFEFLYNLHSDTYNKRLIDKFLSQIQSAKDPNSAEESLKDYLDFLMPLVRERYMKKGKTHVKKVDIMAGYLIGGGLSYLTFGIPYITPELSFIIGGPGATHFALVISNLIHKWRISPRQNEKFNDVEKLLRQTDITSKK